MEPSLSPGGERLNKYLALALGISRREADNYIASHRVTINGSGAILGTRVQEGDEVMVDGKPVSKQAFTYLLFHKPVGYVSSRRAQGDAPTLYELLPQKYHQLKPVGRLDKDSSGLLFLTNDGDFAYKMTHPKFYKVKTYEVQLDHDLEPLHQQMISDYGVQLEDGPSKLMIEKTATQHEAPAELQGKEQDAELTSASQRRGEPLLITMSEGRNRQIRRTFAALGYTVTQLHRTHFGDYTLGDIQPGSYETIKIS